MKSRGAGAPTFTFLTTGNLSGQDDDPTVAVDAAGNVHVVWFSDRDGTKDLYHVRSTSIDAAGGVIAWTSPVQLTNLAPPVQDLYPSLHIDSAGTLHLAWFRWNASNECHVLYMKSDGTPAGWAAATVASVTSGANFDRGAAFVVSGGGASGGVGGGDGGSLAADCGADGWRAGGVRDGVGADRHRAV